MKDSVCFYKERVDFRCADIHGMKFHALVYVFSSSCRQIIDSSDRVAPIEQALGQIAADKSCRTGHNNTTLHLSSSLSRRCLEYPSYDRRWRYRDSRRPHFTRMRHTYGRMMVTLDDDTPAATDAHYCLLSSHLK